MSKVFQFFLSFFFLVGIFFWMKKKKLHTHTLLHMRTQGVKHNVFSIYNLLWLFFFFINGFVCIVYIYMCDFVFVFQRFMQHSIGKPVSMCLSPFWRFFRCSVPPLFIVIVSVVTAVMLHLKSILFHINFRNDANNCLGVDFLFFELLFLWTIFYKKLC